MGWNDVHIVLAPKGSTVSIRSDPASTSAGGKPLLIFDVHPSVEGAALLARHLDMENWLLALGFKLTHANSPSFTYDSDDISLSVRTEKESVVNVSATFLVNLDARIRIQEWKKVIESLCNRFGLGLVDPEGKLVAVSDFLRLVEASFAWECFLQREQKGLGIADL